MIGRNPLNESYYNPLGRSARSWTDDRKRLAAIDQLRRLAEELRAAGRHDEADATLARLRQLGVSAQEAGEAVPVAR